MTDLNLFNIFGYLAALCMVMGYLPQALFSLVQGFLSAPVNWPLVITNFITGTCSAIVFGIKIYNDYFRKPRR